MKIQSIKSYAPYTTGNKPAQNTSRQSISFGFGEDYGNDGFLHDSDHSSGGNIFEYIGLIIEFPIALVQDIISEKRAERRSAKAEEEIDINKFND